MVAEKYAFAITISSEYLSHLALEQIFALVNALGNMAGKRI